VVYISMGTLYYQDPKFFTFCFEEFRDSPFFVVVSVGAGTDVASLGEIPPNFLVRGFVPQLDVLQRVCLALPSFSLPFTFSTFFLPLYFSLCLFTTLISFR
jgi:UDP:flavonoid glycosyltransferase YjiC (YdhE family)